MNLGCSLALLPSACSHNSLSKPLSRESQIVDCPECGRPLRKCSEGKYYHENGFCRVIFVRHSSELDMTEIACTGLVRNKRKGLLAKKLISN